MTTATILILSILIWGGWKTLGSLKESLMIVCSSVLITFLIIVSVMFLP